MRHLIFFSIKTLLFLAVLSAGYHFLVQKPRLRNKKYFWHHSRQRHHQRGLAREPSRNHPQFPSSHPKTTRLSSSWHLSSRHQGQLWPKQSVTKKPLFLLPGQSRPPAHHRSGRRRHHPPPSFPWPPPALTKGVFSIKLN